MFLSFFLLNAANCIFKKVAKLKLSIRQEINQFLPEPKTAFKYIYVYILLEIISISVHTALFDIMFLFGPKHKSYMLLFVLLTKEWAQFVPNCHIP